MLYATLYCDSTLLVSVKCVKHVDIQWNISASVGQHGVGVGTGEAETADWSGRLGWWNSRLSPGVWCEFV